MVKIISAHIVEGRVVPDEPLPDPERVENVSILLSVKEEKKKESVLPRVYGILKDDGSDPIQEYHDYLEKKYL
jgi:hypothetical protein